MPKLTTKIRKFATLSETMALYNRIDKKLLKERMQHIPYQRTTLSFYQYHQIADPAAFRDELYKKLETIEVWGRIYVANEGINAQISVPSKNLNDFRELLYSIPFLNGVRLNIAVEDNGKSFFKLKILVRKKIVADGLNDDTFDVTNSGQHLDAISFNKLASDPETVIVDMRNHYESEVGHFKIAILPDVDTFRESLPVVVKMLEVKKEQNVIMYCSG
ncbi:MAG: rhodanese-related sulfurtransferase, partial [Cyclobacteriaceae bacterium]